MKNYHFSRMHLVVLFLLVIGVASLYAQDGYKDYKWGMTIDQVKAKCSDLVIYDYIRWSVPSYAFMFIYTNEIVSSVPNPLAQETGEISSYESKKDELKFYFVNRKLVAVELGFFQENILNELEKQNGPVSPVASNCYQMRALQNPLDLERIS